MYYKQEVKEGTPVHPAIWEAAKYAMRPGQGSGDSGVGKIAIIKFIRTMAVAADVPSEQRGLLFIKKFVEWYANIEHFDFHTFHHSDYS